MPKPEFTKVSFYVFAHADDWQLFMQPNTYNDLITPGSKVVFIITTAGDAGFGETYWSAREEGLKSSIRFCLTPLTSLKEFSSIKENNTHNINCWTANNATCYFLRLPDGGLSGEGFSSYQYQSLLKFKRGEIDAIAAVDHSATYNSWSDFYVTLQTIIESEYEEMSDIWINYLNPDPVLNPNDHNDHIITGQAVQQMPVISNVHQALFAGYSVNNSINKLQPGDLFWKAGMFAAYEKAVYDISGYSTLQEDIPAYLNWCLCSSKFITVNP